MMKKRNLFGVYPQLIDYESLKLSKNINQPTATTYDLIESF